ncbi:triose-phosphate isomerase [Aeropyrum camini]|uniref:Triosephosphate isomerase n=1 Tax=Aeropyrum camini SY1 = JCM 12091 TaxID=1198449 RepID=U3TEH5_9CREN|nr:triose-phosphate isomerase [Aeropyrum camini]BAN90435.1 triosephosphate isomerase [Aeropyrum camini SY1 = JCM 12091]
MKPVLAVNMKTYRSAFGPEGRSLARDAGRVAQEADVRVILVAPLVNASSIAGVYGDVYIQHADPLDLGAHTGYTPVEAAALEGFKGVMVNHSEHKVTYRHLQAVVERARELGLEVLACADTPEEAAAAALLKPAMVALEPPELIGTGIPVSRAKPEVITRGVEAVASVDRGVAVLAGAGITSGEDAKRAVELGARGVLVASAVMKAKDPYRKMLELAEAMARV